MEYVDQKAHENIDSIIEEEEYSSILGALIGKPKQPEPKWQQERNRQTWRNLGQKVNPNMVDIMRKHLAAQKATSYNPMQELQTKLPQNPYTHLKQPISGQRNINIDKAIKDIYGGRKGDKSLLFERKPRAPGFGALGATMALAPLLQELIYHSMGLDPSGLENQPPEFPHLLEGSSYESSYENE